MECIKQKALAGFDPAGHSESYIQTELVNPIYAPVIRQPIRLLITKAGLPVLHDVGRKGKEFEPQMDTDAHG